MHGCFNGAHIGVCRCQRTLQFPYTSLNGTRGGIGARALNIELLNRLSDYKDIEEGRATVGVDLRKRIIGFYDVLQLTNEYVERPFACRLWK